MKTILLFGAGKSATACIEFLGKCSADKSFIFIVADADENALEKKTEKFTHILRRSIDILNAEERQSLVQEATVVISMLPPTLHILVAQDCVAASVHLLTASYLDEEMLLLQEEVKEKSLTFICELGLDPGLDHMSAMQLITDLRKRGASLTSFKSHCGGLVAKESDDNPWHYKISWNPKNIVNAGKQGALYLLQGKEVSVPYEKLFDVGQTVTLPAGKDEWSYYANRDSLAYIPKYGLSGIATFMRTTLRHPIFIEGWQTIVHFNLTSEDEINKNTEITVMGAVEAHLAKYNLLAEFEERLKTDALFKKLIDFLGLVEEVPVDLMRSKTMVTLLQHCMEEKLLLHPHDKDLIVMVHEIEFILENERKKISSVLQVKGNDSVHTAMAKTVGLPLAIAAKLIIEHKLYLPGLHIPTHPEIYELILPLLAEEGIAFEEFEENISAA